MQKSLFFTAVLVAAFSVSAANALEAPTNLKRLTEPPFKADAGKHWSLIYDEEFDETTLDTSKLTPCPDWNYNGGCSASFNHGKEYYLPSQVQVSDGTAKLIAEPMDPPIASANCYQDSCTYKAGLVSTARADASGNDPYLFSFTYGYLDARVKFPGTPGFFTAFWMLPANTDFQYQNEIDIAEILGGYPDTIWMHVNYNNRVDSYTPNSGFHNNGSCNVQDYSGKWVRLGVDWEPTHVAFYIDGTKCGQFDGDSTVIESGPMYLILNLMVDNDWERLENDVLASQDETVQLEVDYIRIYQQQ